MPLYFFGLPDDLASPEAHEELANDAEAREVAQIVANELSRNRYDGEEVAVVVFNDSGQLIHKVWTRPHAAAVATTQTLFPEHVHPKGIYQSAPRRQQTLLHSDRRPSMGVITHTPRHICSIKGCMRTSIHDLFPLFDHFIIS